MRVGVIKVRGDKMLRRIISFAQSKLLLQATSSKGLPMASRYLFSGSAPCPTHLLHNLDLIHIINMFRCTIVRSFQRANPAMLKKIIYVVSVIHRV